MTKSFFGSNVWLCSFLLTYVIESSEEEIFNRKSIQFLFALNDHSVNIHMLVFCRYIEWHFRINTSFSTLLICKNRLTDIRDWTRALCRSPGWRCWSGPGSWRRGAGKCRRCSWCWSRPGPPTPGGWGRSSCRAGGRGGDPCRGSACRCWAETWRGCWCGPSPAPPGPSPYSQGVSWFVRFLSISEYNPVLDTLLAFNIKWLGLDFSEIWIFSNLFPQKFLVERFGPIFPEELTETGEVVGLEADNECWMSAGENSQNGIYLYLHLE